MKARISSASPTSSRVHTMRWARNRPRFTKPIRTAATAANSPTLAAMKNTRTSLPGGTVTLSPSSSTSMNRQLRPRRILSMASEMITVTAAPNSVCSESRITSTTSISLNPRLPSGSMSGMLTRFTATMMIANVRMPWYRPTADSLVKRLTRQFGYLGDRAAADRPVTTKYWHSVIITIHTM